MHSIQYCVCSFGVQTRLVCVLVLWLIVQSCKQEPMQTVVNEHVHECIDHQRRDGVSYMLHCATAALYDLLGDNDAITSMLVHLCEDLKPSRVSSVASKVVQGRDAIRVRACKLHDHTLENLLRCIVCKCQA